MVSIIADKDRTPVQVELWDQAKTVTHALLKMYDAETTLFLNRMIAKYRGLNQNDVYSYLSKIQVEMLCYSLAGMKAVADQVNDNECSIQSFFDEMIEGIRLKLGLDKLNIVDINGVKKIHKPCPKCDRASRIGDS
jgi:hypothetical protein